MEIITPSIGLITWVLISFLALITWLIAIVDIVRNDFKGQHEKLVWVLTVLVIPLIGSILYFVIGRKNRIKNYY